MNSTHAIKRSLPGVYNGYSAPVANGYRKYAVYVTVRDGCRLATDYYRPTRDGRFFDEPLPTVCISTGYRRSFILKRGEAFRDRFFPQFEYGDVVSWVTRGARLVDRHEARWLEPVESLEPEAFRSWLLKKASVREFLLMHGYNLVIVDNRSTGSSFGRCDQLDHQTQAMDLGDLFEWVVAQSWSTDHIGMTGNSWLGLAQNAAISCNPKFLRAVLPITAGADTFVPMYPGGLYNVGLMRQWYHERYEHESGGYESDVVDEDVDGTMRAAAVRERQPTGAEADPPWILTIPTPANRDALLDKYAAWSRDRYEQNCRYLDRDLPDGTRGNWRTGHLDPSLANKSSIAYYAYGGHWDLLGYDTPMAFEALTVPRKLLMGPWNHANWIGSEAEETLRWFDCHLKHIDNGIMTEPAVTYSTSRPDGTVRWFASDTFPPAGSTLRTLYASSLDADGSCLGRLSFDPPVKAEDEIRFVVDYDTTSGLESRQWGYALGLYLNLAHLERFRDRIATLVSEPLVEEMEVTGYPLLAGKLSISSDSGAIFAYLQDIGPDGRVHFVSDSQLNFRDRKEVEPPYTNLGLPYHSIRERDRLDVTPGELMDVRFALNPVSWVFPAGHRVCLTLTGADLDNFHQIRQDPAPTIVVRCGESAPLTLTLPTNQKGRPSAAKPVEGAFASLPEALCRAVEPSTFDPTTWRLIQRMLPR